MATKRKTVEVNTLKTQINALLACEGTGSAPRMALARVLESVLMDTGNYRGYGYIKWMNGGCDAWQAAGSPEDNSKFIGDESLRVYY